MSSSVKKRKGSLSLSLLLGTIITIIILSIIVSLIGYRSFTKVLEKQYNNNAYEIAQTARTYLNPDKFKDYLDTLESDEEYELIQQRLDDLTVSTGCNFIYVAKIDPTDYLSTTYIYDSVNPATGFDRYPIGYTATDGDPKYVEDLKHILETGGRAEHYLYSYTEKEAHTTAGLGVTDSSGNVVAVIGVEKTMSILDNARKNYVETIAAVSLIIIVLVIVLYSVYLNHVVVYPITEIMKESERFAENHENIVSLKAEKNNNEIGTLAESIKKMEKDIIEYMDNLTKVTAEKERIGAELNVATQIQADMLPGIFPAFPERNEFDIYATMTPAKEVGGDFYDFFFTDDDHLALVMADVSGKGVPAALFMVIAKTLIKNRTMMGGEPSEIFSYVNNQLCEGNEAEMFVTAWLCIIEISTGKCIASNAGHEYPAIKRANGKYELYKQKHSPALATMEGIKFRQYEFSLNAGDSIYVYTDGVAEATNSENQLFGTDRMLDALNSEPDASPEKLLNAVEKGIDGFILDAPQFDDITMLCLHYYGKEGEKNE